MKLVDSHCHAGLGWYEPVELLLYQMNLNAVDKAVLIQTRGTYDNTYLFECSRRFPGRFAVVVLVDTSSGEALSNLRRLAAEGAIGVRLEPKTRSPGPDPLAIWRTAAELGLVVSCGIGSSGKPEDFASDEFNNLVAQFPNMPIVIEHLAFVQADAEEPYLIYRKALALSDHPNTYIKIGGLGEISLRPELHHPQFSMDYTPPVIDMAYDTFGPRRMMWGSDYPPVSRREGYGNALRGIKAYPGFISRVDREWIMGETAHSVFQLD